MTDTIPASGMPGTPLLARASAKGSLDGMLFTLAVEQYYSNPAGRNIEAVFTIPLPLDAVLLDISCTLGDRTVRGHVAELTQAAQSYDDAIEAGHAAVLLERAAAGLYTINLGNLLPGERATVQYRFAQLVHNEGGQVRIAIPTAVAPRHGHAAGELAGAHQVPRVLQCAAYPFALDIRIAGSLAAARIGSPSHTIRLSRTAGESTINANAWLDRDFVLVLDELRGLADGHAAGCADTGAIHLVHAQFHVDAPHLPARPVACRILLDCSGSMTGPSIRSARSALCKFLGALGPRDRLSLSCFGTGLRHVVEHLAHADAACNDLAVHGLLDADADMGGTNIGAALEWAMQKESTDILVVTDGQVWNTGEIVAAARAAGQRVFAVGVGSAPVESLLRELAAQSGGACEFVAPGENMDGAVARILARMRQPCLEGARVEWPGEPLWQTRLPSALPVCGTVHTFAGFSQRPAGQVTLRAGSDNGSELAYRADIAGNANDTGALARIAASLRLRDCARPERIELALEYGLVTEHTSMLLVHERDTVSAPAAPARFRVPHMLTAGWSGGLPSIPACFRLCTQEPAPQRHAYDVPAFLLKSEAQESGRIPGACQDAPPQARMTDSTPQGIDRMHDMKNWYVPLEQASTLDELHARWAPLLEQSGLYGANEDPRYADAVMRFLAHARLPANLKFGAVFACVSPFDFDLRLAYSALMEQLDDQMCDASPEQPILHSSCVAIPCSSEWLLGYVHGRYTEVVRAMGRSGLGTSEWPAMFWNHYLVMASRDGDAGAIREAVGHGADVAFDGRAAAAAAAGVEQLDTTRRAALELLRELDPDRDAFDATAMAAAAAAGGTEVLSWLFACGVNVASHPCALAAAAGNCQLDCAQLLLERGADIHAGGESALLAAIGSLHSGMIEFLLDSGADLEAVDEQALAAANIAQPFDLYGGENDFADLRDETVALLRHELSERRIK